MKEQDQLMLLYDADPHCYWCRVLTVMSESGVILSFQPDNLATRDHLIAKKDRRSSADNYIMVLACRACNQRRNVEDRQQGEGARIETEWNDPPRPEWFSDYKRK